MDETNIEDVLDMYTTSTMLDNMEKAALGAFEVSLAASSAGAKGLSSERTAEMKRSQSRLFDQIRIQEHANEIFTSIPPEKRRYFLILICVLKRFAKGFGIGFGGKFLFAFLGLALKTKLKPKPFLSGLKKIAFTRQTLGYGAFTGGFLAIFEGLMRLMARNQPLSPVLRSSDNLAEMEQAHSTSSSTNPILGRSGRIWVSGLVASAAFLFLPKQARSTISMFFLVRAIEVAAKGAAEDGYLPYFEHGDTLLMALASAQVIWAWLNFRESVDPSYLRFVDHQGGRSGGKLVIQETCTINLRDGPAGLLAHPKLLTKLNKYRGKLGFGPLDAMNPRFHCENLHPETSSCVLGFIYFLKGALRRAAPVYIPIFVIPQILFRPKSLITKPITSIFHVLLGIARSSTFLSMYCGVCWLTSCFITDKIGWRSHLTVAAAGFMGGTMVSIEKKNRRIELALYVLSQALPSFYMTLRSLKLAPVIKHSDIMLFAVSVCILVHSFLLRPHLMRSSYVSLFRFLFGKSGKDLASEPSSPNVDDKSNEKE